MSDLRVGQKVRIVQRLYGNDTGAYGDAIGKVGIITRDNGRNNYNVWETVDANNKGTGHYYGIFTPSELERIDDMEAKFKVGDRVVDADGEHEREIIKIERIYRYRTSDKYDDTDDESWRNESEVEDWSLVSDKTEVTLEDIAKKFNIPVSKLRIKE